VRAANETLGRAAIPLGRHSAMNGYGIPASNIDGDAAMKLAAATKVLSSVIDRLYAWRREQVTLYVRQMQPHHNQGVRLSAYLEHVGTFYEPGEAALRMLCRELVADFPSESMGFS
jgi:hypothetical protein